MNISVTIPQIFYDVIARVLPGCLFLFMLKFQISGTKFEIIKLIPISPNNSMAMVLIALLYIVLSYFVGWALFAGTFWSVKDKVEEEHELKINRKGESLSLVRMYHRIRIKNEAAGFRIVKLRAEARMLERSRTSMVYICAIALVLLIFSKYVSFNQSPLVWASKLCIPALLAGAFWKCERHAWDIYFDDIWYIYEILYPNKDEKSI